MSISDDGNYWWDGSAWQPMSQCPVGTRSNDGNYWWDGSAWQSVGDGGQGGQGGGGAESGGYSGGDHADLSDVDWSQFPELSRLAAYGGDIDAYLTDLGVDPSVFTDDSAVS